MYTVPRHQEAKIGQMVLPEPWLLIRTYINMLQQLRGSFRNWYARQLHRPPHSAGVPPPFSLQTCRRHCSSSQTMRHKGSLLELSIHNLSTKHLICQMTWKQEKDGSRNKREKLSRYTGGSPTAKASLINVLNVKTDKPRSQRDIFICVSMEYMPKEVKSQMINNKRKKTPSN